MTNPELPVPTPKKRLAPSGKRGKGRAPGPKTKINIPPRYEAFVEGRMKVEDLDDEELIRGQLKDVNGHFTGRVPMAIPRSFHTAVVRELVRRQEQSLLGDMADAYGALREIALDPRKPAVARNQAAIYLIERVAGKIPDRLAVQAEVKPWEDDISDVLSDTP